MSFFEVISKMPVMWLILAGALLALYFFFEKVLQFHRDEINVPELLRGLENALKRKALVEALTLCDHTPGPAAKLLGAAILAKQNGEESIRQAMDEIALVEIPRLEHHVGIIGTIGVVMPFAGFLGTVLEMLKAAAAANSSADVLSNLLPALGPALMTTATALVIAIPCFLAHNYLVARVQVITLDMEKAALEITSVFKKYEK